MRDNYPMGYPQQQNQNPNQNNFERLNNRILDDPDSELINKAMEPEHKSSERVVSTYDLRTRSSVRGIKRLSFPEFNSRDISTSQLGDDPHGDLCMIQYKLTYVGLCSTQDLYDVDLLPVIDFIVRGALIRANILKAKNGRLLEGILKKEIFQTMKQDITERDDTKSGGFSLFNPRK